METKVKSCKVSDSPTLYMTPRERDLLRGIVAGRTNREIAQTLGIGVQAVKNPLSVLYEKCYVRNRLELALFVLRNDISSTDIDTATAAPTGCVTTIRLARAISPSRNA
jgi:DNA-binding NarL/FixJ family response regulator